jgi:hypothetical protein
MSKCAFDRSECLGEAISKRLDDQKWVQSLRLVYQAARLAKEESFVKKPGPTIDLAGKSGPEALREQSANTVQ